MRHHLFRVFVLFVVVSIFIPHASVFAASSITRSFGLGAMDGTTGGEVTILQKLLVQDTTIYPEQLVTGYFGPATERAVQRWQKKYNIVTSGTPATTGYGWVGSKTRESINNNNQGYSSTPVSVSPAMSAPIPTSSALLTQGFGIGATDATTGGEVTILQKLLAQDASIYPEKQVTGFFGPATERAVQRWQQKYNIVKSGTPATTGYGWIGVKTRMSINAKYASNTGIVNTPVVSPTTSVKNSGALSVKASPDLVSTYSLSKSAVLTNTLSSTFVGTGNGLKVTFTQKGAPKGISVPSTLSCVTPCSVENKVTINPNIPEGKYPITVEAIAGTEMAQGTYIITIGSPVGYSYSMVSSGPINVKKALSGSVSGNNKITLRTISGEPEVVTITQAAAEKGITVKSLGNCTAPCEKTNAIIVGPDVISGVYGVTVKGVSANGVLRSLSYNISVSYNENFGFHVSNQEDLDKSITMTLPVGQSVTSYIPLKFILDGGSPSYARVVLPTKFPVGVSASISGCTLPCDATLVVTVSPEAKVGTFSVPFSLEADYTDLITGQLKTLKKSYSESLKIILGNMGTIN